MFKASIQRQVRLGHVTRQLSTVSLRRNARPEHLSILHQTPSQPALQHLLSTRAFPRLYSVQSASARASRQSESTPVPSTHITRFSELSKLGVNERLVEALTRGMGYDAMTEVQSMSINAALRGSDMVAQAKTGTGKTLAFLVPLVQRVLMDRPELATPSRRRASSEDIRAIILSPTRELAEQIGAEARKLVRDTAIVVQTAVGGTRKRESLMQMRRQGCDILVATPGRLNDLLNDPEARVAAPNLQAFVLDEADRMLDVGFTDELRSIQDSLPSRTEVERQTLLFSATIPRDVVHLAKSMVRPDNFEFVQTIKEDDVPTHERVPQHLVTIKGYENIYPTILEIAHKAKAAEASGVPFKAIVFFSSTAAVQFAYRVLRRTGPFSHNSTLRTYEIHSKLTQAMRTRSADSFRAARSAILFSSDVTARGMDFPNVTDVIQVGLPPDRDQYIHRVGRTGRAGNAGKGWLILSQEEIPEARIRLRGLPIKPNDTIESAKHGEGDKPSSEDVSRFFSEVAAAYSSVPKSEFRTLYLATLGQKFGRQFQVEDVITLLNQWCMGTMGWSEPPAIPPRVAQNRGLTHAKGVRIGHDPVEEEPSDSFGDRFGDRFGGRSGGRSGDRFGDRFGGRSGGRSGDRFGSRSGDRFGNRSGSNYNSGRGNGNGFGRGRGRSPTNTFESRFASRSDGGSGFNNRSSF